MLFSHKVLFKIARKQGNWFPHVLGPGITGTIKLPEDGRKNYDGSVVSIMIRRVRHGVTVRL